jgi:hypothetical protein
VKVNRQFTDLVSHSSGMLILSLCILLSADLCFVSAFAQGSAIDNKIEWKELEPGVHLAEDQEWKLFVSAKQKFTFSAVRFHLGYYDLKLVSGLELSKRLSDQHRVERGVDRTSALDLGIKAIYEADPFKRPIRAIVSAGFPASERKINSLGLLRIDRRTLSALAPQGPSAIFCLNSPNPKYAGVPYQKPVFYRLDDGRLKGCDDAVQVGPRILEDPSRIEKDHPSSDKVLLYSRKNSRGQSDPQPVYLGIPETDAKRTPFYRTVFAVDEPGRDEDKRDPRKNARNAYLIVTETSVTLWDIQNMLISHGFYSDEHFAPYFALSLVGGDYAGLLVKDPTKAVVTPFGNVDIAQASVLVVLPK